MGKITAQEPGLRGSRFPGAGPGSFRQRERRVRHHRGRGRWRPIPRECGHRGSSRLRVRLPDVVRRRGGDDSPRLVCRSLTFGRPACAGVPQPPCRLRYV